MTALGRFKTQLFGGVAALTLLAAGAAQALPTGGVVVADQVPGTSISTGPTSTDVYQNGDRVIIDWDSFDVAPNEQVNFYQPSETAVTLNRVLSTNLSHIDGEINAQGGVFIFAPGGMLFGETARVNVGAFLASSVQLPTSEFSNALNTDSLFLPPPASLASGNPYPEVTISEGAQISAWNGFVALIGPQITMNGIIAQNGDGYLYDIADSVIYVGAEGADFVYDHVEGLGGGNFQFTQGYFTAIAASPRWVDGRGQVTVTQGAQAQVLTAGGYGVITPPPVLEAGFASVINLSGTIQADGRVFHAPDSPPDSVLLLAGPALPPGHSSATSGLVSPGSLPFELDLSGASVNAAYDITASVAGSARLGDITAAGDIAVEAYGDIVLDGDLDVLKAFFSNGFLIPPAGGVGDVAFNADVQVDETINVVSSGLVTFAPGVTVSAPDGLVITNSFDGSAGVASVTLGDSAAVYSYGHVIVVNEGGLILEPHAVLSGGFVELTNRDAAGAVLHSEARLEGGQGLSLINTGPVVVDEGAVIASWYYDGPDIYFHWPVSVYDRHSGGVYILASDLELKGHIYSSLGEGGYAPIVLEVGEASSQLIVGGADAASTPGIYRLSNTEFQNLYGFASIGASPVTRPTAPSFDVRDLDLDGSRVPILLLTSFGDGDILVSGTVQSSDTEWVTEVRFGRGVVTDNSQTPDTWVSQFPRDILVTGALGSENGPLSNVLMAAQRDILIGTPSFVDAAAYNASFDPQFPQQVEAPDAGHLFVDSTQWLMLAGGRIIQQNSALLGDGHSGFLIDLPGNNAEPEDLVASADLSDEVDQLANAFQLEFDFGANPPAFPDFTQQPTRISLHGVINDDGDLLVDNDTATAAGVISSGFTTGPTYYMNDCQIGGCATSTEGGVIASYTAIAGFQYPAIIARRPGVTIVNQASDRVVIDWPSLDVDLENALYFNTLSDTAITFNRANRVVGDDISIDGVVEGNAGVFLISPQGVFLGEDASISVGSLLLSSLDLTDDDAADALDENSVRLTPGDSENLFPAVVISSGAHVQSGTGLVALIGSSIDMHGRIDSADTLLEALGDTVTVNWRTGFYGGVIDPVVAIGYTPGQGEIFLSHNGYVDSNGFMLVTPPPVLANGEDFVLELSGYLNSHGSINNLNPNDGVLLSAGGVNRAGYVNGVLVHAGSGTISLDASGLTLISYLNVTGGSYKADFGTITSDGLFHFGAVGDIAFFGPVSVASADFGNGPNLPFGVSGDGDILFHDDFTTTEGNLEFGTLGGVVIDPGVALSSSGDLLFGAAAPSPGASSVAIGAGASLSAQGDIGWNGNNGPLAVGAGAQITAGESLSFYATGVSIGQNAILSAADAIRWDGTGALTVGSGAHITAGDTLNFTAGSVVIGQDARLTSVGLLKFHSLGVTSVGGNAQVIGGRGLAIYSSGVLSVAAGALLQSSGYQQTPEFSYPLMAPNENNGGVYIEAPDIDLQGQIVSLSHSPGEIIFDVPSGVTGVIVGGADLPPAPGVFQLSNAEFQRLHGFVIVGSPIGPTATGLAIEVRDLAINGTEVPTLTLGAEQGGDIGVTGVVQSSAGAPDVRIGAVIILDDGYYNLAANFLPRDILVTGALGTEAHPLGGVSLLAGRDILMGTSDYIAAARTSPAFDPLHPPLGLQQPLPGQIFVAADTFQFAANGRVFQQNSGTPFQGAGIVIGAPTDATPLVNGFDFQAELDALDGEFNFGPNTPHFPDFSNGPLRVSLWGKFIGDGFTVEGPEAAQNPFLLSDNLSLPPHAYYLNGCEFFGACPTSDLVNVTTFHDPIQVGGSDPLSTLSDLHIPNVSANNPLIQSNDLIAEFIEQPDYDPDPDPNGIGQAVTGSGNGDLWTIPQEAR